MLRQQPCRLRNIVADDFHLPRLGNMQNQGIVLRTPLGFKNMQNGVLVKPVCAEAVDRLGWDGDELALADQLRRQCNLLLLFG